MEDFIPIYPSSSDPDIQRIITAKKEFNELRPDMNFKFKSEGENRLMNHQELFARLSTINDRMLNIHETGTGKTCSFIAMAERYKYKGAFKKCIILEKSDTLINEVRGQILNVCAPGEYSISVGDGEDEGESEGLATLTERALKKKRNEVLKNWYEPQTYETFANGLEDLTDDQITAKYDKHIFIFDEAHNIVTDRNNIEGSRRYNQYQRLCSNIPKSKLCFASATPMTNSPEEIIYLMNLLLPADQQIPLKNDYRLSELEPYFRGKISYIKPRPDKAEERYMGDRFEFTHLTNNLHPTDPSLDPKEPVKVVIPINMYLSKMGDLQVEQYKNSPPDPLRAERSGPASMVFPIINGESTIGEDYYDEISGKLKWKSNSNFLNWEERGKHVTFQDWIYNDGNLDNLRRISGKFAEIVNIENSNPGCSFIFGDSVAGAGVKMITLIFQLFGYEIFLENSIEHIFVNPVNPSKSQIKESYPKKLRVALITSGTHGTENRRNAILNLFNSPANVNGDYIKILIGSRKAKEGINVYHCQRMHLVYPLWTYSSMIQAINRTLRATSHINIKEYKIQEALKLGYVEGSPEYLKATEISVSIYRHCIDYNIDENIRGDSNDNCDYAVMKTAVEKEVKITKMMNMLKSCAVDALINRPINEIQPDDPFNFDRVKYIPSWTEIIDPTYTTESDPIDYSTYNVLYIKSDYIVNKIKYILLSKGSISYDNIYDRFKNYTKEDIFTAIETFKSQGKYIENNLGEKLSLEVSENGLHIQRFYHTSDTRLIRDITIYDFPQVISSKRPLAHYLANKYQLMIRKNIANLIRRDDEIQENKEYVGRITKYLMSLDRWDQMMILEEIIKHKVGISSLDVIQKINSDEISDIISIYKGYFYDFNDRNNQSFARTYVHTLTTTSEQEKSHNIVSKHENPTQIKVFVVSENRVGWRLPYEQEDLMFRKLIKEKIDGEMEKYVKFKTRGTILQDGKFRLIDENTSDKELKIAKSDEPEDDMAATGLDRRMKQRGSTPFTINKKILIKIAIAENLIPPCGKLPSKKESIAYLREAIKAEHPIKYVNSLTDEEVRLYHAWEQCSNVAKYFQIEIIKKLREEGRLYEPYILTY